MRKLFFICSLFFSTGLSAQFIEFGGGIGTTHYTGDLTSYPRISESQLAATAIYRLNFSDIISVKFAFTAGQVSGNDDDPVDVLGEERQHSFKHGLLELSSVFEYHFLSYRSDKSRNKWSPYAFFGIGFVNVRDVEDTYEDFSQIQFVLPMGGGVKYELSKRFTLGAELGARRTFFDYLDGISDGDQRIKNYQYGNPNDNDWYFYTGVNLTYVLYNIPCPFKYVPNRSILGKIKGD